MDCWDSAGGPGANRREFDLRHFGLTTPPDEATFEAKSMNAAFITSLVSAMMSLIAIIAFSAMTVAPHADSWRGHIMLVSAVFFLVWVSLTFWLRPRPMRASLPGWVQGLLMSAGVVYIVGILLFVIG
jgi:hypothetical protein